jgi:AcrR family transcriptional regulator
MSATATEGLRERKKRETREAIAHHAMKLFAARGFDAVTVADVAHAAGVSEKTVFNYFPAKEDLVLHGGAERLEALIEAIRARPRGASFIEPFRAGTMAPRRRQPIAPRPPLPGLGAGGRAAGPCHRRGGRSAGGRPRPCRCGADAGVDAPRGLSCRPATPPGRRGPARGRRRPARGGRSGVRPARARARRLRRQAQLTASAVLAQRSRPRQFAARTALQRPWARSSLRPVSSPPPS